VVGYGGRRSTRSGSGPPRARLFDFQAFSPASSSARWPSARAESLTRVSIPTTPRAWAGAALRAGVLPRRLLAGRPRAALPAHNADWSALPEKVAIQLNDTHPAWPCPS
jgi:starch phosphorylase